MSIQPEAETGTGYPGSRANLSIGTSASASAGSRASASIRGSGSIRASVNAPR